MTRKVEVVPHYPEWKTAFEVESQQLIHGLGNNVIAIHHIGSTAIPDIYAKPILDFLVEVADIAEVEPRYSEMTSLGYEALGEFGITGRRFFLKNNSAGVRTHHVHVFEVGSAQVERHLAFRDYLIAHSEAAQEYSELKQTLARIYPTDIDGYIAGKQDFIQAIDQKAARWRKRTVRA